MSKQDARPISGADYKAIAFDRRLAHGAHRLWHILRDYSGKKMMCWPGQRRLCRDMGSNFESVGSWRDQLIECGWLRLRIGKGGRHVYMIGNFSSGSGATENGSAHGSGSTPQPKAVAVAATESGSKTNVIKLTTRTEGKPAPRSKREGWQQLRDEKALKERLEAERESTNPDRELIESLKIKLRAVRDEMKGQPPP